MNVVDSLTAQGVSSFALSRSSSKAPREIQPKGAATLCTNESQIMGVLIKGEIG